MAKRIGQQRKSSGRLAAVWIVKMVARKWRTPVLQNTDEPSVRELRSDLILHHVGQPESGVRRARDHMHVVERELPVDADADLPTILFKLPGVEASRA